MCFNFFLNMYAGNFRTEKTSRDKVVPLFSTKLFPKFEINLLRNEG